MKKTVRKVRTTKDIIISLVLLLAGAACFAVSSTGMMILGGTIIATGVILFFVLKNGYRIDGEPELFSKKEHFFSDSRYDAIYSEINAGRMITDFKDEDKAIVVRLDVYTSHSGKRYAELYKYIPYDYVRQIELKEVF